MKNITVTLDEKTAAWARLYAAKHNKSLSRFLGELLHKTMRESQEYESAMRSYLERTARRRVISDGAYPGREEVNERRGIR